MAELAVRVEDFCYTAQRPPPRWNLRGSGELTLRATDIFFVQGIYMASNSLSLARLLGNLFKTQKARFTFVGFLFGASFPVGAVIIDSLIHDLPLSIPVIVQHNPLHYLIATAPLVLGFLSGLAGIRDDRIQSQQEEIESINTTLARRNQEMQDILYHIDQGILTINSDFSINQEYSSFLEHIFQRADLQGVNFLNLIYPLGPASNKKDLKEFLELLFNNKNASESVISDLNPIKELEFALTEEKGEVQVKYLNFDFVRIMEGEQIRKVMVIIKDLTEKTMREKEHAQERREFEQELHRISAIVKVPLEELEKFIEQYESLGKKIEIHFSTTPRNKEEKEHKREELNNLLSQLHALKGEARLYELSECAQKIHLVEEKSRMQQQQDPLSQSDSMNQAMEVMLALSEYKMAIKAIKDTRDKLQEKLKPTGGSKESERAIRELLPHLEELSATIEEQIQSLKGLGQTQNGDSPAPGNTGWLGELEPLLQKHRDNRTRRRPRRIP